MGRFPFRPTGGAENRRVFVPGGQKNRWAAIKADKKKMEELKEMGIELTARGEIALGEEADSDPAAEYEDKGRTGFEDKAPMDPRPKLWAPGC